MIMTKGYVYVAGPMRGYPAFNFPAFFTAQEILEADGWTVFNPAQRDIDEHGEGVNDSATGSFADVPQFSLREALADDTRWISLHADHIYMLDGWENSAGARAEKALAEALGHTVLFQTADVQVYTPAEQESYMAGLDDNEDVHERDELEQRVFELESRIEEAEGALAGW